MENQTLIYVRLLEGGEAIVPCLGRHVENETYEIYANEHLDLENDATSIWEFFPGDIVLCERKGDILLAKELVSSSVPNRKVHQFIFQLVSSLGNINPTDKDKYRDEIKSLSTETKINQRYHPIVNEWLRENTVDFREGRPSWL